MASRSSPLRTPFAALLSRLPSPLPLASPRLYAGIPPPFHASTHIPASPRLLSLLPSRRFLTSEPEDQEMFNFPGLRLHYSTHLQFTPESPKDPLPCFRLLNLNGQLVDPSYAIEGRISFYLTTIGEEAINIASAAALDDSDVIFSQYREPGVLMWRGFTLQEFADQCFGNEADLGKGRQMPIHYGSNELNYFTVASPVATQIPHAVGAAYSLKMSKTDSCAVTYFGDGGTSEGDFHAGLNFAGVLDVPVLFFCRNNGWAISTPISDQFRSTRLFL